MSDGPECFPENWTEEFLSKKEPREAQLTPRPAVINNESVIFFDVDDTLVMWDEKFKQEDQLRTVIIDPYDGRETYLVSHKPHIKLLKNHSARGSTIVVWSQGGYQWAEAVVKALGLEQFVDLIMTKPRAYVDDLPVQEWLTERIYISPDSSWGKGEE